MSDRHVILIWAETLQQHVIFYYESFRKVTEQDKEVDSYFILKRRALAPTTYMIHPSKNVLCGVEKHGALKNMRPQKFAGPPKSAVAPESAGLLTLAQSASPPPLIRP